MVSPVPIAIAVAAAGMAAICAASDGALLAIDPEWGLPPSLRALYARRERPHRALAFARLIAQLIGGVAVATALAEGGWSMGARIVSSAAAALLLVGASEGLARSTGDT